MKQHWRFWLAAVVVLGLILGAVALAQRLLQHRWAEALKDENAAVRAAAVREVPLDGNEPLLITALQDPDTDVRLLAVTRLGDKGPNGTERARALIPVLKDDHAGVRREAAWALGRMGPDAWPALQEGLRDENARVRAGSARALSDACRHKDLNPWPSRQSQDIAPILRELLNDPDPEVRGNAEEALKHVTR